MAVRVGRGIIVRIGFRVAALLASLLCLAGACLATGCGAFDHQRLVATWHYVDRNSGPVGYAFGADGRYKEYYKWDSREATQVINGSWGFGVSDESKAGVILKADHGGFLNDSQGADGALTYRFSGDDLYLEDERLVRVSQDTSPAAR